MRLYWGLAFLFAAGWATWAVSEEIWWLAVYQLLWAQFFIAMEAVAWVRHYQRVRA